MQRVTHKMCVEKHMLIDSGVDLIAFFASSKLVFLFCYRNSSKDQLCFLTNKHSKILTLLSEIKRLTCICILLLILHGVFYNYNNLVELTYLNMLGPEGV